LALGTLFWRLAGTIVGTAVRLQREPIVEAVPGVVSRQQMFLRDFVNQLEPTRYPRTVITWSPLRSGIAAAYSEPSDEIAGTTREARGSTNCRRAGVSGITVAARQQSCPHGHSCTFPRELSSPRRTLANVLAELSGIILRAVDRARAFVPLRALMRARGDSLGYTAVRPHSATATERPPPPRGGGTHVRHVSRSR
jgi:hypothetical protein